jgi:phosphatidate phosphatase APP1
LQILLSLFAEYRNGEVIFLHTLSLEYSEDYPHLKLSFGLNFYFRQKKMSFLKGLSFKILRLSEKILDGLRRFLKTSLGIGTKGPLTIVTYRGFGTNEHVFLMGRVMKDKFIFASAKDSRWRNFVNTFKRFGSSEIPGARLQAFIGENTFYLNTDEEGYFKIDGRLDRILPAFDQEWRPVEVHLTHTPWAQVDIRGTAKVLIPRQPAFGVISDIDDTIIKTDVTSLWKLKTLYLTFLKNAGSRMAFREVSAFYRALAQGPNSGQANPFFYVSNTFWNLYDMIEDFMDLNQLPKGPILLRDFGIPYERRPVDYRGHKHSSIIKILDTYPEMPFILIGDSGENDADIYLAIAAEYPGRILAIYIRDVRSIWRAKRIAQLIRQSTGIEMHLVRNYRQAAALAAGAGFMKEDIFEQLKKEKY